MIKLIKGMRGQVGDILALLALNISVLSTGASAADSGEGKGAKIKDDWMTINKDYSSQCYVDLVALRRSAKFSSMSRPGSTAGSCKVERTLYVSTPRLTYAFDAATCDLEKTGTHRQAEFVRVFYEVTIPWCGRRGMEDTKTIAAGWLPSASHLRTGCNGK